MTSTVTAVIPSVPPRAQWLGRALTSVAHQTRPVDAISVAVDNQHEGPGATRTRALMAADTTYIACLDDDDKWAPEHIEQLVTEAERTDADLVYSWMTVVEGVDPFPQFFAKPWSNEEPHIFGCWFLARTEVIREAGGWLTREQMGDSWKPEWQGDGSGGGEDWHLIQRLVAMNAKIVHLPVRTYLWRHSGVEHYSGRTW